MATLQQLTPGAVFARDYRVIRPLAEGGMGAPGTSAPPPTPARPRSNAPILAGVALLGACVPAPDRPAATVTTGAAPPTAPAPAAPTAAGGAGDADESDVVRFNRATAAFRNSRIADECWRQTLRENPAARAGTARVSFTVTAAGRFTNLDVDNSPDPRFTQCIRARANTVAPLGPGSEIQAQISINLTVISRRSEVPVRGEVLRGARVATVSVHGPYALS